MLARRKVQCIVFRKSTDYEFLLLRRIPKHGGFWQPVTGGVEQDEPLIDAVYRELFEETSISMDDVIRTIDDFYKFEFKGKDRLTEEHVFGIEVKPDVKVNINANIYEEHDKYRWVSFNDAMKLLKWDSNKEALKQLKVI